MTVREIRKFPDSVLRERTERIQKIDKSIEILIDDMIETMHDAPGVGLAANQVGVPLQVAVIDITSRDEREKGKNRPIVVIINPEILSMEGSVVEEEGCLSIPEYAENVKRAEKVKVRAQDRTGKMFELEAEGLMAKALQHEIDHLNGLLFVDRLSPLKKSIFKRKYKKLAMEKA
jgi:peptide deformylase